jgi:hypothetical protein
VSSPACKSPASAGKTGRPPLPRRYTDPNDCILSIVGPAKAGIRPSGDDHAEG